MSTRYNENDKMCDVICDEPALLQMICRFGIPLGVGDKTVDEICRANGVDTATFLAVANYIKTGSKSVEYSVERVSVKALITYLAQAHAYFLNYQMPTIRRKLLEAIDCSCENEVAYLILKFYDEYTLEVRKHMQHENRKIFSYVRALLDGVSTPDFEIAVFARTHEKGIELKLQELKNIIIKYCQGVEGYEKLAGVLYDIFNCEADLRMHCAVEDDLFVPAVRRLEAQLAGRPASGDEDAAEGDGRRSGSEVLSDRELEVVRCIVRGMSNKEVAAHLFISINTVLTHRKNIARKLNIHSTGGLTIYAIANKLVRLDEIQGA